MCISENFSKIKLMDIVLHKILNFANSTHTVRLTEFSSIEFPLNHVNEIEQVMKKRSTNKFLSVYVVHCIKQVLTNENEFGKWKRFCFVWIKRGIIQ